MPDANITKNALAAAMKALVSKQGFAQTSVGDICEQCGMNRKSFYYHFRDKYDLANWVFYTEFFLGVREKEYDESWPFLLDLCTYFYENRMFYVNILKVTGQDSFRAYFLELFMPVVQTGMEEVFSSSRNQAFYATFFADALLMAVERWLGEGTMPPEELVTLLREGIEGTSQRVVERMNRQD